MNATKVYFKGGLAWIADLDDDKENEITLNKGVYAVEDFHPYEPSAYVHEPLFGIDALNSYVTVPAYECIIVPDSAKVGRLRGKTAIDVYRRLLAIRIVKYVGNLILETYKASEENDYRREEKYHRKWRRRNFVLKIATKIHKNAATQQMAEEGWWG